MFQSLRRLEIICKASGFSLDIRKRFFCGEGGGTLEQVAQSACSIIGSFQCLVGWDFEQLDVV